MHDDKASLPKLCNAPLLGICMDIKNNVSYGNFLLCRDITYKNEGGVVCSIIIMLGVLRH